MTETIALVCILLLAAALISGMACYDLGVRHGNEHGYELRRADEIAEQVDARRNIAAPVLPSTRPYDWHAADALFDDLPMLDGDADLPTPARTLIEVR